MKKQTKTTLIIVIAVVVAFLFLYPRLDLFSNNSEAGTGNKKEDSGEGTQTGALPVNVIEVKPERLENNLNLTGNLLPNESVELRPEITGRVQSINFKEGQFVRKGTPLVSLNDDELKAQLERLEFIKKLYEGQERRQQQLLEREAISQEEYDVVLNQYNTNMADIDLIKAQLRKMVIRAPFDGVVGLRQISEGAVIGTADVIANIVSISPIKIEFSIPERYSSRVKTGSKIRFTNNSVEEEYEGEVYAFEPVVDHETRTLKLRAISPNQDGKFLPGMFVNIQFNLDVDEEAIMVPSEALVPELDGYKLFLSKEGKVEERRVRTGVRTATKVQIVDGLDPGELVLTTGVLQAKEGMPVNIKKTN